MHKAKDKGYRAHGPKEIMHTYGPKSTPKVQGLVEDINAIHTYGRRSAPIAQGLVYDINAPHAFRLRESKPNAMHVYGRSSAPIAQGLVYDINAPHALRLRESKPNAMHVYGRSSAPIAQGLVYDINAPHALGLRDSKPNVMHAYGRNSTPTAQGLVHDINTPHVFGLRESKRTYGPVSTPIAQGLVATINAKDQKNVMSPKAQGLVNNTHHGKKYMLKNCTHDRMSGGKAAKRSNSGATAKKTTFLDETNHAVVSLTPKEDDSRWWVSTLAPLTLLKAANKYVINIHKGPNKGLLFEQIQGQTFDILWVFYSVQNFSHCKFIQPHDGWITNPATRWLHHTVGFSFLPL